jgi:iron complex outermembrane receptor protein
VWVSLILASLLTPLGASADEATADGTTDPGSTPTPPNSEPLRPFFLGEVVVSADEDSPPGTTDQLDAQAIEAAGVTTVAEALELLPGVSLSTGGRNEQKLWVRGYEQSNVLVLVDGIPVSDPYFGDLDLGQMPVFDIARITVTRGGASPLYGPNGLGGVINVVTLQGGDSRQLAVQLRLTDNQTTLAHASAGGGIGKLSWYLGLGIESSEGWDLAADFEATSFEDGGTRVNSDYERSSALARVGWRLDDRSTLYASLRWIDSEKGIPFHTTEPAGFVKFARFPEWRQASLALGYERRTKGGGELRGQLYGLGFENTLDVYDDPELVTLRLESEFSDRVYGGYVLGDWQLSAKHGLGAALHLRRDRHIKTERFPDGTTDPSERYRAWTSSVSVEDRWRIGTGTSLIGSLAAERLRVEEASTLRLIDGLDVLVDDPLSSETLVSPQLELRTELGARWTASAAVYRRARFPTVRQLYGTDPPNPGLRPQRNTGVDLGVSWSAGPVSFRGNLFADQVRDLISRQGRTEPFRNQDEAEFRGIELRATGSAGWLEGGVSWTGLDHRFTRSSEGMEEVPFVPRSEIELMAIAHLGPRIDLRGSWLLVGDRVFYDRGDKAELDDYRLLDLGLAGRLGDIELSIHVDNLFDEHIEQEEGFPLPGRRLWAGVRAKLGP